jgi:hypothetical protein
MQFLPIHTVHTPTNHRWRQFGGTSKMLVKPNENIPNQIYRLIDTKSLTHFFPCSTNIKRQIHITSSGEQPVLLTQFFFLALSRVCSTNITHLKHDVPGISLQQHSLYRNSDYANFMTRLHC